LGDFDRPVAKVGLAQRDQDTFGKVEALFLSALEEARRQDALSWELRTALSLARFWKERQRSAEAGRLLERN
jgi:predicted ATPase